METRKVSATEGPGPKWRDVLQSRMVRRALPALLAGLGVVLACTGPGTDVELEGDEAEETREEPARPDGRLTSEEQERVGPGNWRRARQQMAPENLTEEQLAEIERLEALGYVGGSRDVPETGVTRHDGEAAQPGINLYTSGHGPVAFLVDMDGNELHRWRHDYRDAFPDYPADRPLDLAMAWWCWVHLYENGDLLALFNGAGIVKVNARSELIWAHQNRAHHDLAVADDGTIYVLTKVAHIVPYVHETEPIVEDFVVLMSPGGDTLRSFSILEAFAETEFKDAWRSRHKSGDVMHTNSIEILDGRLVDRIPAFKAGNLLLSIPKAHLIAVVDSKTEKIVWAKKFRKLHDVQIVGDGNILQFDNRGKGGQSRALETDPETLEILWEFPGDQREPLRSGLMGAVQRLENGNTLVTESEGGRVIEVAPDGRVVWEFYTPHRAGDEGEFIASICRMKRLPADFGDSFTSSPVKSSDSQR
jgi:hypothetical protein